MNKKRITSSALAALMIAGSTSFTAMAEIPSFTAVVGDKAFDLNYLSNATADELDAIRQHVVANEEIFVKDMQGNWVYNSTLEPVADVATEIPAVTYKDAEGNLTEYAAGDDTVVELADVKVDSAVAINSTVVEVTLDEAAEKVDASQFTVINKDGEPLEVANAELAPWDSDNETVLVTLADETESGTLYTVKAGDTKANFGGRDTDEDAATFTSAESTEYNEVTLTFDEAVKIDTANIKIAEKYGNKDELKIVDMQYGANNEIILTTEEQADATLYAVTVTGLEDLAGNEMDETTETFVGQEKPTADQTVTGAEMDLGSSTVVEVTFGQGIDEDTALNVANYTVAEKYGSKTAIDVVSAEVDEDDDTIVYLTLADDTKEATLYQLTVKDVMSKYGTELDGDAKTTFVGNAKDEDALEISSVEATSNTEIVVTFNDKVDADTAADMFEITEKYGDKDALEITDIDVDDEVVTLTTAKQSAVLYQLKVLEGIADDDANITDEDLTTTFVGVKVADEITKISSIINGDDGKSLTLTFDQNVGEGAYDVANYFIDGGIGYPTKASSVKDHANQVKLTIPATKKGKLYTVTVNNVANADGVAMDSDGIEKTFVGTGIVAAKAKLEAVMATDNQTLKIFFDRDVTDSAIKGVIWDATNHTVKADITNDIYPLKVAGKTDLNLIPANTYAYQDPNNDNALIVRVDSNDAFNSVNKDTDIKAFTLVTNADLDEDADELVFAYNNDEPAAIEVESVLATSNKTVRVYFDQATYIDEDAKYADTDNDGVFDTDSFAQVIAEDADGNDVVYHIVNTGVDVEGNHKVYDFTLDRAMDDSNDNYRFVVEDTANNLLGMISDSQSDAKFVTLADQDDDNTKVNVDMEFAPDFEAASDITDISVVMPDAKTIVVYYPEIMNAVDKTTTASAINPANYEVKDGNDSDANTVAIDIGDIAWDGDDNTVTITLKNTINTTDAFLYFSKNIKNATGSAQVKDDTDQVYRQFAVSDADPAGVAIDSVKTIASDNTTGSTIEITFDQDTNVLYTDTTDETEFVKDFAITIQHNGSDESIGTDEISAVAYDTTTETFTVTLEDSVVIDENDGVTVKVLQSDAARIVSNVNAEGLTEDDEVTSPAVTE